MNIKVGDKIKLKSLAVCKSIARANPDDIQLNYEGNMDHIWSQYQYVTVRKINHDLNGFHIKEDDEFWIFSFNWIQKTQYILPDDLFTLED